ncbi:MAG: SIS domain-containing protein [Hyphomicrobiales bacterium]
MASDIDAQATLQSYEQALSEMDRASALGQKIAGDIKRVYLVGCGGPNRSMLTVEYWIEHYSRSLEVRRYFPAEFMTLDPKRLDAETLVILGSKSGTTPETTQAAEFLRGRKCQVVAITEKAEAPLAQAVKAPLLMGASSGGASLFMILQALVGGLMAAKDGWELFDPLMSSLHALPQVMVDAALANDKRSAEDARLLKDDRILYHVAAGPTFATAYVWGVCVLMEMQWMHSVALEAAEFFHGPFEIVDQNTPLVLIKGEDPSRPLMDRVERFCKKYTERLFIYDSKDYEMKGVDPRIRPIVAANVLQAPLRRISERLAVWHNHPLTTRRYMWKTAY